MVEGAVLYHVGFLMCDRENNWSADGAGNKMWRQYKEGKVHLIQRRRGVGVFEYWSIPNTGGRHVENHRTNRVSTIR